MWCLRLLVASTVSGPGRCFPFGACIFLCGLRPRSAPGRRFSAWLHIRLLIEEDPSRYLDEASLPTGEPGSHIAARRALVDASARNRRLSVETPCGAATAPSVAIYRGIRQFVNTRRRLPDWARRGMAPVR